MIIDILLSLFSLFFLIRELIPNADPKNPKLRRNIYTAIAGCFFFFSLINIFNKNEENQELIGTAKEILGKTEEINTIQDSNSKSLEKSRKEIVKLDSVLGDLKYNVQGQVGLLESAVKKSKELVELEKNKFSLGRAKIEILSSYVKFVPDFVDSTKLNVAFRMSNRNPRSANDIEYTTALVLYNTESNIRNFYTSDSEYALVGDLSGNNKVMVNPTILLKVNKEDVLSRYKSAIFIIRVKYFDEFDNQGYDENFFFSAKRLDEGVLNFYEPNESQKKWSSRFLMDYKMHKYLTNSTIEKYK